MPIPVLRSTRPLLLLLAFHCLPAGAGPLTQPAAPARNVVDTYSGVAVEDPYRGLEQLDNPEVKAWARAQGAYTRARLDSLPGLPVLRKRIDELDASSSDRLSMFLRTNSGALFYLKRRPQDAAPKLYMRTPKGEDKLVFDAEPLKQSTGKSHSINIYSPSPDGRYVAMVLSAEDAELGAIHVMDVASGKMVGAPVDQIWGELPAMWIDKQRFVYERSAVGNGSFSRNQMFIRRVGSDGSDDRKLVGYDVDGGFKSRENDWLFITVGDTSPYALLEAAEGVAGLARLSVQLRSDLGKPGMAWRQVVSESDKVRGAGHVGKWLYLRTFDGATRYRIVKLDLSRPGARPVDVVPQQDGVIEQFGLAKDALYYVVRTGAVAELFALPYNAAAGKARKVPLPKQGSVALVSTDTSANGALFKLEPWTEPLSLLHASVAKPAPVDMGLIKNKGAGYTGVVAVEAICPARDGARVPVSILMKKDLKRDGANPTILNGYGGYGMTDTAMFSPVWQAWLERGGIVALANPRGSGAYGEEWYQAGRGPTKANTWQDMIDCAQMLVKEGYTSSSKLAIRGVSMGGVAAGRALTDRPDLFATAVVQVGLLDTVRGITGSANGPNHILEMGDVKTEAGIRQLLAMSSYHQVQDGARYPAVLLTTGMNDKRVDPWMAFKMAARLQVASSGGNPVLLRVDEQAGHGMSSTAAQRNAVIADYMSFHLWQIGDPQFQPKPD